MGISFGMWIVIIFGGFIGIASTLSIIVVMLWTIAFKILRRFRYGIPLYR